jgi:hypothetical protein
MYLCPSMYRGVDETFPLDTQTWLREKVPELRLTDENVGLLRGVDYDILTPSDILV